MAKKEQQERLAWWREAKFGMFIHWGLYAVAGGEWKGQIIPSIAEWLQGHYRIPLREYRQLAEAFNPLEFDAKAIVRLAREAGMRYLVITAKHHDGFAMWDSHVSDYNIVKATPFGRDPLKELAAACAEQGIRLGFYYSQDLDWEHPDGTYNTWDYAEEQKDFQRYLEQKVKPQLRELLTNYGPVALIWCDTPVTISKSQAEDLKRFIRSIQPDCLVSGRIGHGVGDYGSLGDNQIPTGPLEGDWEVPATINHTWGFKKSDTQWRSGETLLRSLVDLAAKGANYLLNIGPDAVGRVPDACVERLRGIGDWLRINGAAVYGTQPSPFNVDFEWGRMTCKGNRLYLIFDAAPTENFMLYGLLTDVTGARLLATGEGLPFTASEKTAQTPACLCLSIAGRIPAHLLLPVIELTLAGAPQTQEELMQSPDRSIRLPAHRAFIEVSPASRRRVKPINPNHNFAAVQVEDANLTEPDHICLSKGGLIEKWISTEDWLRWDFQVHQGGEFRVRVLSVAAKYKEWVGGHTVMVRVSGQELVCVLRPDEVIERPRTALFPERATFAGIVRLPTAGFYRLELRASAINPDDPAGLCIDKVELLAN